MSDSQLLKQLNLLLTKGCDIQFQSVIGGEFDGGFECSIMTDSGTFTYGIGLTAQEAFNKALNVPFVVRET
jgi:hypothetical protein